MTSLGDRYSYTLSWLLMMHAVTAVFQLVVACSKMYENKRLVETLFEVVNVPVNIAFITYAMNQLFFCEKIISSCQIPVVYFNHKRAWLWIECFLYWINVMSLMAMLLSRTTQRVCGGGKALDLFCLKQKNEKKAKEWLKEKLGLEIGEVDLDEDSITAAEHISEAYKHLLLYKYTNPPTNG